MNRKFKKVVVSFLALIFILSFNPNIKVEAAIANKPGDIIVTNGTSLKGISGHIGIYIDSKTILHTSGRKSEPWPKKISEKDWHSRYKKSKVIRPKSSASGKKAAQMAKKYFVGKHIPYRITTNPKNISKIYCSELVWYSYYKAGKQFKTARYTNSGKKIWQNPGIIEPYDFLRKDYVSHNGFKFIDNKW